MKKGQKTRIKYLEQIRDVVAVADLDEDQKNDYIAFIDRQIKALQKRRVNQQYREKTQREETDELTRKIYQATTTSLKTIDEITAALIDDDKEKEVTRGRVVARLDKLERYGYLIRGTIKMRGRRRKAYRRPTKDDL